MTATKKKIAVKIFLGVILGLTTLITLSILTDEFTARLNDNNIKVDAVWLGIFFFYRIVYTAIGGFIAAKIAKEKPFITAKILGGIVAATYFYGLYTFWNQGANGDFIFLAITGLIAPYIGAYIATRDKTVSLGKNLRKRETTPKKEVISQEENLDNLSKETPKKEEKAVKSAPKKIEKKV